MAKVLCGYVYPDEWSDERVLHAYRLEVKQNYLHARDRWKRTSTAADVQLVEQIKQEGHGPGYEERNG